MSRLGLTVEPYEHQRKAFSYALHTYRTSPGVAYLMEVGTGKTLPAAWTACHLAQGSAAFNVLVVCPIAVFSAWKEAFAMVELGKFVTVLEGTCEQKSKQLKRGGMQVAIVNYESAWRILPGIKGWRPDMIICDESQKIKNPQSKQAKALHALGDLAAYKMILTGTPVANSPLDFYSQYRFLDKRIFGLSYYSFRARYAELKQEINYVTKQKYSKVIGYRNQKDLTDKAHSIAMRVRKEDCLDLPEQLDEFRYLTLEPEAARIYRELRKDAVAEIGSGVVSTPNIITKLLRLSQVTGGYVGLDIDGTDEREVRAVSHAKLDALTDIAEEVLAQGKKLVVFARFRPEITGVETALKPLLPASDYMVSMTGDTPSGERGEIIERFQSDPRCRVFIGNPQCAGAGITLTAADTMVFYSLSYSYLDYEQARARIHRIGQRNACTYIHLLIGDSVDIMVMDALRNKQNVASIFVDRKAADIINLI